jgi:hypothetical protein
MRNRNITKSEVVTILDSVPGLIPATVNSLADQIMELTIPPAWVLCELCEDYWCNIHEDHVQDCDCPDVDTWIAERDLYPYDDGTALLEFK